MTTYHVTVTREDNLWVAEVAEPIGQNVMDYQHLSVLHEDMPDFIADMLGESEVTVEYRYEVNGHDVTHQMRHLLTAEHDLHHAQQEQERARKEALAALTGAGVSQRVMADALGLSHQRVHQLVRP